jgi:hypothetical protein
MSNGAEDRDWTWKSETRGYPDCEFNWTPTCVEAEPLKKRVLHLFISRESLEQASVSIVSLLTLRAASNSWFFDPSMSVCTRRIGIREGQRNAQEEESPSLNAPKPGNTVAANVDEAQTADTEGEKALDCAIVANFIDAEALTSDLRDCSVLEPGEVDARHHVGPHGRKDTLKAEFVILEATGTQGFGNAPGEVELGGSPWDIHVKDDTLGVIEGYEARLVAKAARTDGADSLVAAVPRLASVPDAENFEISQLDMLAAFLKDRQ